MQLPSGQNIARGGLRGAFEPAVFVPVEELELLLVYTEPLNEVLGVTRVEARPRLQRDLDVNPLRLFIILCAHVVDQG